jgi:hypothetical protein
MFVSLAGDFQLKITEKGRLKEMKITNRGGALAKWNFVIGSKYILLLLTSIPFPSYLQNYILITLHFKSFVFISLINMTRPTKNQTSKRKLLPQYHVKYGKVPKLRIFRKLINMIQPTKKAKIKQAKESLFLNIR